jgi:hypothetical protein
MPGENVYSWSTTAADNGSTDTAINWIEGQARATVNNSARAEMAAIAKFRNLLTGVITTTGTANAQAFASGVGYTETPTGLRVLLKIGFKNTGPATLNMDGIGDVAIKDTLGNDLRDGELPLGGLAEFDYNGTNWILLNAPSITVTSLTVIDSGGPGDTLIEQIIDIIRGVISARGYIDGLTLSYASTTSISVAVGAAMDSTSEQSIELTAPITKTTAVWAVGTDAGGLDTGTIAASTWYHVFLITRSDTDVVDVLFSLSPTAPTLPTDYDFFRRIGSCKTNATSEFRGFFQVGDFFTWQTQIEDGSFTAASPVTVTLSTPSGVQTVARITIGAGSAAGSGGSLSLITPGVGMVHPFIASSVWIETVTSSATHIVTGMASDVIAQNSGVTGLVNWTIRTNGWLDARGRDA